MLHGAKYWQQGWEIYGSNNTIERGILEVVIVLKSKMDETNEEYSLSTYLL
jgi:hypothetical protein